MRGSVVFFFRDGGMFSLEANLSFFRGERFGGEGGSGLLFPFHPHAYFSQFTVSFRVTPVGVVNDGDKE